MKDAKGRNFFGSFDSKMEWVGVDTYFNVFLRPFPQHPHLKMKTNDFLMSSKDFMLLLENLGFIYTFPRMYMQKCIKKISKKFQEDDYKYRYIEDILLEEKEEYNTELTEALFWLRRHFQFFLEFFEFICNDETLDENISLFAKDSYMRNLERYQNCCVKGWYKCMISLMPSRTKLLMKMAFNHKDCDEFVLYDMNKFTINLRQCVYHLKHFYIINGLEWDFRV
ncbi:hypothetical protein FQA39_LY06654 [Lamprigera yunnana]|nr:hypothetical protein FQA39_LY06654 [Lamprigera yunnana]